MVMATRADDSNAANRIGEAEEKPEHGGERAESQHRAKQPRAPQEDADAAELSVEGAHGRI